MERLVWLVRILSLARMPAKAEQADHDNPKLPEDDPFAGLFNPQEAPKPGRELIPDCRLITLFSAQNAADAGCR